MGAWQHSHQVEAANHDAHGSRAGGGGHEPFRRRGFVFATKPHVGWVPPQVRSRRFACRVGLLSIGLSSRTSRWMRHTPTPTPTPTNLTGSPPPPHCLCTCYVPVCSGQRSRQCTFKSRCHACRCVTAPTPTPALHYSMSLPPRTALWNVRGNQFAFHSNSVRPHSMHRSPLALGRSHPSQAPIAS
jgi:hypothetical protein